MTLLWENLNNYKSIKSFLCICMSYRFIINGKSQASTVRLTVGTGYVHQEVGYCLTRASCRITCRINEDLKRAAQGVYLISPLCFLLHIQALLITHGVFLNDSIMKFILGTESIHCLEDAPTPCPLLIK